MLFFSCSTQLSMKFETLISTKIARNSEEARISNRVSFTETAAGGIATSFIIYGKKSGDLAP